MSDTQPDVQGTTNEAEQPKQADPNSQPAQDAEVVSGTDSAASAAQNGSNGSTGTGVEMQLADAQAKAAEYLDGWQRSRADFANYKKRAEKEREEVYQVASAETLRKLLPVIDDFDRAIANVPTEKAEDDVIKGFSLIHRKMLGLLDNSGIKVINPVGEAFNPALHEAIGQDDSSDVASGHITAVLQKGYVHGDKVLRPALVRVAS
jgi:molecular chaperone GrpE